MDSESDLIVNRVASSGLVTLNLEDYYHPGERVIIDIKDWLFREQILKEDEFRQYVKAHNWSQYEDKNIAVCCSSDAIVPTWAYMLIATAVEPFAHRYIFGAIETLETVLFTEALHQIDFEALRDMRVIVKGCGNLPIPVSAYVELTHRLLPVAKSIMYGEACSNVPLWKRK